MSLRKAVDTLDSVRWPEGRDYALAAYEEIYRCNLFGRGEVYLDDLGQKAFQEPSQWINLPFAEAIEIFKDRLPILSKEAHRILSDALKAKSWTIAGDHSDYTREQAKDSLVTAISDGWSKQRWVNWAKDNGIPNLGDAHLETVFDTNVIGAYQHGRWKQQNVPNMVSRRPYLIYMTVDDARVRPNHAALHGFTALRDHPAWDTIYPTNGFRCFLPGTMVSGSFLVGLKTLYSGPAIEIKTALGNRLSVTANHPVLTSDGWVRAGDIKEGQTTLSYGGEVKFVSLPGLPLSAAGNVDNQNRPATVEDVFETLSLQGAGASTVQLSPLDLHGDGRYSSDGKIDVVFVDRELRIDGDSCPSQEGSERDFIGASPSASVFCGRNEPIMGDGRAPGSSMGSTRLSLYNLGIVGPCFSDGPLHSLGVGLSAKRDPEFCEKISNDLPANAVLFGKCIDASSMQILRGNGAGVWRRKSRPCNFISKSYSISPASDFDSIILKKRSDGFPADSAFFSKLLKAGSGKISPDKIISVRRFKFVGHVYDLQSVSGWILANNICTSNCRCRAEAVRYSDDLKITPNDQPTPIDSETGKPAIPDEGWATNPGEWLKEPGKSQR